MSCESRWYLINELDNLEENKLSMKTTMEIIAQVNVVHKDLFESTCEKVSGFTKSDVSNFLQK